MAENENKDRYSETVLTPVGRMSFPNVKDPKPYQGKGDPKYSVELLFEPEDLKRCKAVNPETNQFEDVDLTKVCSRVFKKNFPNVKVADQFNTKDEYGQVENWVIKNGNATSKRKRAEKKKGAENYEGKIHFQAKTNQEYPPRLFVLNKDRTKTELHRGIDADEAKIKALFVGGNYAYAEINVKAYGTPQGRFVTFYLGSLVFVKTGERFGGQSLVDRYDGEDLTGAAAEEYNPTDGAAPADDDDVPY